jgi:uncharacterized protein YacL
MKEDFVISIPQIKTPSWVTKLFVSLLIAFLICFPLGLSSIPTIFAMILLTMILYLFIHNMAENPSDALPFTTIPTPPHMGLDGIDVDNLVAGIPIQYLNK